MSPKRPGIFTVGALDNLDHNPSSATARDSFHGTGISLVQFPSSSSTGDQNQLTLPSTSTPKNHQLPDNYTTVPVFELAKASVDILKPPNRIATISGHYRRRKNKENCWLEHAAELLEMDTLEKGDTVAWASYYASTQIATDQSHLTLTQLMPLFYEKAATAAMVKHGMTVLQKLLSSSILGKHQ